MSTSGRISYLDGLRGIACMQVMVYHYFVVFEPHIRPGWLCDGQYAVSIFFILSGVVLTKQYKPNCTVLSAFCARIARLGIPVWFAVLASAAMMFLGAGLLPAAVQITHTPYMPPTFFQPNLAGLLRDLTGFSMLVGFEKNNLFPFPGAIYQIYSTDPVIW